MIPAASGQPGLAAGAGALLAQLAGELLAGVLLRCLIVSSMAAGW
jgi:hypothetical protein